MAHPDFITRGPVGMNQQYDTTQAFRFPIIEESKVDGVGTRNAVTGRGSGLAKMWYNEQPTWVSRTSDILKALEQWEMVTPYARFARQLFNTHQYVEGGFGGDPEAGIYGQYHNNNFLFHSEMAARGWKQLWVLMSGPSQRMYGNEPGSASSHAYSGRLYMPTYVDGDLIRADRVGTVPAVMAKAHAHQVDSWTRHLAYLKNNPDILASTLGFELINEPDTYNVVGTIVGVTTAMTYYVNHCLALIDLIDEALPGMNPDIWVGGWKYSAWLDVFWETPLPSFGNQTPMQIFSDRLNGFSLDDPDARGVWSVHLYPGWVDGLPTDMDAIRKGVQKRFGIAMDAGHRVSITESNSQNSHFNNVKYESIDSKGDRDVTIRKSFMLTRHTPLLTEGRLSTTWWPYQGWAAGSVIDAAGTGSEEPPPSGEPAVTNGIWNYHQNSLAGFYNWFAYDNNPQLFDNYPDNGIRKADRTRAGRGYTMDPNDFNYDEGVPVTIDNNPYMLREGITGFAIGVGGNRVCVIEPCDAPFTEETNHIQIGGNGKNILYGGQTTDDNFFPGRGGSVVRVYGGTNNVSTNGGYNLIYCGTKYTMVAAYWGWSDIVIDPTAVTWIIGFYPQKGTRLVFKGLVSRDDLMARLRTVNTGNTGKEVDLYCDFPEGGQLRIINGGRYATVLDDYVRDYTDGGWYAGLAPEPADYDPAEFLLPPVPPPPEPSPSPSSTGAYNSKGQPIGFIDRRGNPIGSSV